MNIYLKDRTADNVRIYYEKANTPEIIKMLPQKARSVEEFEEDGVWSKYFQKDIRG